MMGLGLLIAMLNQRGGGSGGGGINWILETGFWNDNEVWNDNATWID